MSLSKVTLINDNKFGYLSVASFGDIVLHILTDIPEQSFSFPEGPGTYPLEECSTPPIASLQGTYTSIPPVGEIDG